MGLEVNTSAARVPLPVTKKERPGERQKRISPRMKNANQFAFCFEMQSFDSAFLLLNAAEKREAFKTTYSGDLNSEHSNYGNIRITNF